MQKESDSMPDAMMERLSKAICDESVTPSAREKQLEGIARMLSEAPGRLASAPPQSGD
jgi:hypothetical protein